MIPVRAHRRRRVLILFLSSLAVALHSGCGLQIYNFGGSGHGNEFILPAAAASDKSPVVQSWIAYSLARSACQLEIGGEEPSENSSFDCELRPREVLAKRWSQRTDPNESDAYLDALVRVRDAGLLGDYVWVYLRERSWERPEGLELERFDAWRAANLRWHRPKTRLIGYWTRR